MREITVKGLVQGIGYRPFVAELAEELHIRGWCRNTSGVVTILAGGEEPALEEFQKRLLSDCPKGGHVDSFTVRECSDRGCGDFRIEESNEDTLFLPDIPVDLATCKRCEGELLCPDNRRYRHPFISCVSCGPRYSILHALPYDRENITMRDFALCPACEREYREKGNVRRHAQTIACPDCGPVLHFERINDAATRESDSLLSGEEAFAAGIALLKAGGILAIKDIGGYHLACLPHRIETVRALRLIKGREKKPFALMYADEQSIAGDCYTDEAELSELTSVARPIVLLKSRIIRTSDSAKEYRLAANTITEEALDALIGQSPDIGAMLPGNPLQILLMQEFDALVMTSANASGEPMIRSDERMLTWLSDTLRDNPADIPVGIWSHERDILVSLDDSVVRFVRGRRQILRRARGFVPSPIAVEGLAKPTLALGGDLKAVFAYGGESRCVLSGQMGDLEDYDCAKAYERELARLGGLLGVTPQTIVADSHPGYHSHELARKLSGQYGAKLIYAQHHWCHVLSVIAEHKLSGKLIGCAMDGTGYGTDGTIWGSEFFLWDGTMKRMGHLRTVTLPGGNAGARNTESTLYGFLAESPISLGEKHELVRGAIRAGINTVRSSSMGRLFDAAAALLGVCLHNDYEGEAPTELEYLAATTEDKVKLALEIREENGEWIGESVRYLEAVKNALDAGYARAAIARGFIDGIADFLYDMVERMALACHTKQVALSGGTFLNRILTERVIDRLSEAGYSVYLNEAVPPGDGGIALGQMLLAAKEEESCV